jgi:hypothetical protein
MPLMLHGCAAETPLRNKTLCVVRAFRYATGVICLASFASLQWNHGAKRDDQLRPGLSIC